MRKYALLISLIFCSVMFFCATAQSQPSVVEIIVVGKQGSTLHMLGETVAATLNKSQSKKSEFVVTRKSSSWFAGAIKRGYFAKTDGSQLMLVPTSNASTAATLLKKELTPVAMIGRRELALIVSQSSGINRLSDFKKYQEKPFFVGASNDVTTWAALRTFKNLGVPVRFMEYQSTKVGLDQLAARDISAMVAPPLFAAKRGDLKAITVFSNQTWKTKTYKAIETATAQGVPVQASTIYGIVGPPNMSESFARFISSRMGEMVKQPDYLDFFKELDTRPEYQDRNQYRRQLEQQKGLDNLLVTTTYCTTCTCSQKRCKRICNKCK